MSNKFCIFCGKELEPGANFCYYCGQAVEQEEMEQEPVANNDPTRLFTRQEMMRVLAQSEDVGEDPLLASLPDAEPSAFTAVASAGGYEAEKVLPRKAAPYEEQISNRQPANQEPDSYRQPTNQEPSPYYQEPISYGATNDFEEERHPKKRSKAPLFALIGVLVLALAFGVFWFVSLRTVEVDLTGNMSVDAIAFEGKDGAGTATLDRATAQDAIDAKNGRAEAFVHQVNFELDKESGLSNGDTVTVTATYPYGLDEKKHLSVIHTTKTFKVSGLEDVAAKPKEEEEDKDKEKDNPMDYNMANGEYYFDTVKLTEEHLKGKTDAQLQEAINYICAMNGRKFRDESWNNKFSAFSWYNPKYGADEFDGDIKGHMSETEYYNYQMLIDAR